MFNYQAKINRKQKFLLASQYYKLVANHQRKGQNHAPVVKIFDPDGAATWLLSELDPETGIAFGLCDLGMGSPELGYVDTQELINHQKHHMLGLERDLYFEPKPMEEYLNKDSLAGV